MGIKRVELTERQLKEKTGSRKVAKAKSKKDLKDFEKRMAKNKHKKPTKAEFARLLKKKSSSPALGVHSDLYGDWMSE